MFSFQKISIFSNYVIFYIHGANWHFYNLWQWRQNFVMMTLMAKEIIVHSWYPKVPVIEEKTRYWKFEITNSFQSKYGLKRLED